MSVQLNHTIVHAHDKVETAEFLASILGVPEPTSFGPFLCVELANGVTLDVADDHASVVAAQHYAFLVSEDEFDTILGRIRERGLTFWADPLHHRPSEINTADGGRGLYWEDPNGHNLEIITRPYGSGA
ncbi:MAG: VOC family protein [Marmoricola sp.]